MAKFHFCVSLLPFEAAKDHWTSSEGGNRSVEYRLHRCLASLINQTAIADATVHVGHHELPEMTICRDSVKFHKAPFPLPSAISLEEYNTLSGKVLSDLPPKWRRGVGDKYSKIKLCMNNAFADPEARWIMFVDHDDMIDKRVVEYALEHDGEWSGGHTITKGYGYSVGSDGFTAVNGFHKVCGSCNAIRLTDHEKSLWDTTKDVNIFGAGAERKKHWLFAGHASTFQRLRNAGRDTLKFPFRAGVYVKNTGSNITGGGRAGSGSVPIDDDIRDAFGLEI